LAASQQKAFTSASAKNNTLAMMEGAQKNPAAANLVYILAFCWSAVVCPSKWGLRPLALLALAAHPVAIWMSSAP
jgi:ribonuclease I